MYLFSIIILLATWLISKSSEYKGLEYILLMLGGFILIIKAWLLARSKILDSIVNLIAKLSVWQIKLIALFQIAIAWILLM